MITMLRRRVVNNIWVDYLKVKVIEWPCSKIVSLPYVNCTCVICAMKIKLK